MKGVLFTRKNWLAQRRWYWHIVGGNFEIMCSSEPYNSKQAAANTLFDIRGNNSWVVEDENGKRIYHPSDTALR